MSRSRKNHRKVRFTPNLIFDDSKGIKLAVEICEDLWANYPPSSFHTLMGANIIANPSASNEVYSKSGYRKNLVSMQSAKCICAYVYSSSGPGESTTDLVFSGHKLIADNGTIKSESRFQGGSVSAVIDTERIENDRIRISSAVYSPYLPDKEKHVTIPVVTKSKTTLPDTVNPYPFIPSGTDHVSRCLWILFLQEIGLSEKLKKTGIRKSVIGISGGLDSTLALLVTHRSYMSLGWPAVDIIGVTMPGFGTTGRTKRNADLLMEKLGITRKEIDIRPSCTQHMKDIGHPIDRFDVTYENIQARERT